MEKEAVLPAGAPPEAFIEALCGYRFSDDGVLHEIADTETAALRARLRASVENASEWQPLITWWLTAPQDRPLFPGDKLTRRERADRNSLRGMGRNLKRLRARSHSSACAYRDGKERR